MSASQRIAVAGRVFCIAVILGLALVPPEVEVLVGLAVIAILAATATYLSFATPVPTALILTVEAAATGFVLALALPGSVVFLPYLVVLTLIAGLVGGLVGVSAVVIAQFGVVLVITMSTPSDVGLHQVFRLLGPWVVTSIGSGLLGTWLARTRPGTAAGDDAASYESAHRLLTQLRTVARRLSSGLDPVTMGSQVLDTIREHIPADRGAVFVHVDGALPAPLVYSGEDAVDVLHPQLPLVTECWIEMEPASSAVEDGSGRVVTALPLRAGSRMVGVVLVEAAGPAPQEKLADLMPLLDGHSLRLDTALAFDEIRTIATMEERRRLAREIHDGIAQEVASLGYLVDELTETAESPGQQQSLAALRQEVSRVVSELRLSIFDLRSEVLQETGLGVALSEYVRQVGARSGLTVHVTLAESPNRMRVEAETQLLRIAQEAITNARKHSAAENLWVDCRVDPPFARLEVRDDGVGLTQERLDSYGLRIMKERAERVNGRLRVSQASDDPERPGTIVSVTIGRDHAPLLQQGDEEGHVSAGAQHSSAGR